MNKKHEELNLTDQELVDLKVMRDHFWNEDIATRQLLLQKWRRLKFFWNNITNVWYDSVAHDWRIWNAENLDGTGDSDQSYYDQRINVFKAYLESIIAALSVVVPPIKVYPDDAENARDIETAKAGDKIAKLIYQHNDASLLWLHGLYIYCTEGLMCGYDYERFDKKYGTYKVDEYEDEISVHQITSCPNCGTEIDDVEVDPNEINNQTNNQVVDTETSSAGISSEGQEVNPSFQQQGMDICPNCNQPIIPQMEMVNVITPILVGSSDEPKGRICSETYGGLNIKVPLYARKQDEVLYLFYCHETHYANSIQRWKKLGEDLRKKGSGNQTGAFDSYEQWARLNTEYRGEYPINCVTEKGMWLKCAAYNVLDEDRAKHWHKKYPDGLCAWYVNDLFAAAYKETLDEHWTLSYNPLADYLSHDPLGMLLTSVQEITNDLLSLKKQTIEHGVGLTFVDPQVVDLNAYQQTEVVPGALIPTKPISGNKKIQDGFFEIKTATLSAEATSFGVEVQSLGQLASGAQPAIFGGQLEGSDTASEYSMSKNQATTRLGIHWKLLCAWWKNRFGKSIPMYISIIQSDEKDVQKREDGSFINVVIRKAELSGKIGKVELEANENLPLSWSQKKDVIMQLLLSPNPQIIQMLMQPENLPVLREAIGLDTFMIPGADDVEKQWAEIQMMLESEGPIETGDPLLPFAPSVEIDVLMDTHPIHFEICRKWCVSEVGQFYKYDKPDQYQNVLLHAKQHLDAQNTGIAPVGNEENPENNGANQEKPKELSNKNAPITGEKDVPTVV